MKNEPDSRCEETIYPDFVRNLPEVDMPIEGIRAWLLEDGSCQMVLFDIQQTAVVPPHKHCAQWGVMLEGEMDLTIDGVTRRVIKGDRYFIPADTVHSAIFRTRVNVIDLFDAGDRYKSKQLN
jgi:quercetin dioxygenase-like cupin family protein